LLMSAAEIASRVVGADAALDRLKAAVSVLDAAARADEHGNEAALNGIAVYAMVAALEANRGNSADARAEGRRRLRALDNSQVKDQSERERLQRIRAVLDEPSTARTPAKAADR
jgi:hypothetical protein